MCYNCGCMIPDDPMGDERNITEKTFEKLAKNKNKTPAEIKRIVLSMLEKGKITDSAVNEIFHQASLAWGQPVPQAKKETLKLLKQTTK